MTTTDVTYAIEIKGSQAKAELAAIGKSAETMGGALASVTARVGDLRAKQLELATALATAGAATTKDAAVIGALRQELERATASMNSFGASQGKVTSQSSVMSSSTVTASKSFFAIEGGMKGLQQRAGPAAAAISSVSAALGQTAGTAGKAVNAFGQMAAAMAAGGPYAGALVATTVIVNQLTEAWEKETIAQDKAIAKKFEAQNAEIDKAKALRSRLTALQKELGGPETASDAFNRVQGEIDAAVRDRAARTAALGSFVYAQKDPQVISLNEQIKLLEKIRGLEAARAAASGMPGAGGATSSPRASAIADDTPNDNFRKQIESIKRARAARDEMIGMALVSGSSADGGLEGKPLRAVTSFYDEATQAAMLSTERQKAMWQDLGYTVRSTAGVMATDMQTLGKGAFSSLVGSAQTYFVALASGEKHAAEIASAAFLSSTGDKLVGFGTEATFKGAGYLIDSAGLDPRGYAMLGLGAAAIGAGIGMGAAAGAVTASIPKDAGKAPKIGTAGGSRGGGGIGGGSSGEGVRYVFNYGIAGPQPDETAREVARQLRRGHSRGFADTSISRGR